MTVGLENMTKPNILFSSCQLREKFNVVTSRSSKIGSFTYQDFYYSDQQPDNIARLEDGSIFQITAIYSKKHQQWTARDLIIKGYILRLKEDGNVFSLRLKGNRVLTSREIGISGIKCKSHSKYEFRATSITNKCILIQFPTEIVAVDFLHKAT